MYKKVLVPLDQSKTAEEVLPTVIQMAKKFESEVTLINILEIIPLLPSHRKEEYRILKEKAETYLGEIKKRLDSSGISGHIAIETGDPGLGVCRYAEANGTDLVILSARGEQTVDRWSLGKISKKVLSHSPCPVLLVRSVTADLLRGTTVLVVDDEPDVLDTVEEQLDMCVVHKAASYERALKYLREYRYDLVVLDIMGVNGFELLKKTVARGIPTVMFTAHALTTESLSESARLGATFFLAKEKMNELNDILIEVIKAGGKPVWKKFLHGMAPYFRRTLGWTSSEEARILEEIEQIYKDANG